MWRKVKKERVAASKEIATGGERVRKPYEQDDHIGGLECVVDVMVVPHDARELANAGSDGASQRGSHKSAALSESTSQDLVIRHDKDVCIGRQSG